ncbi:MAG: glycosyltransferase family 4 protein [Verrucomicrobia bacterium]|nr:glycosyltransferase family 4 protein [Verrucomicrobiota bacterium]
MNILYICADAGIPVLGRKGAAVHVREMCGAFARARHRVTLAAQSLVKSEDDERAPVRARVIHVQSSPNTTTAVHAFKHFNEQLGLENSMPGELRRLLFNESLYQDLKRRFFHHRPAFIYERASLYGTAGVRLAAKFKVPLIVELNAPLAIEQAAYRATGFGELAAQAERWTLTHADAVVVVSAELAKHVRSLGVKASRIHVMPNGVNPELFCPNKTEHGCDRQTQPPRAETNESAVAGAVHTAACRNDMSVPVLGFVGGLRPWHGVEVLPELMARLGKKFPDVRLVIAGDGQLRGELEREFKRRGLTKRVTFTGALLHEKIPGVIRKFDVALAPYPKHNHDFYFSPLKLYEYMACGVPVVAAKLGQIAKSVNHGKTGWLYPPGNVAALVAGCEQLLRDAALRRKIGDAAAKLIHAKFTWDHNAVRVVKLAKVLKG